MATIYDMYNSVITLLTLKLWLSSNHWSTFIIYKGVFILQSMMMHCNK